MTLDKLINPTERQLEFLEAISRKDFVLYGGEAGGGKSYILRWWLVTYLIDAFRSLGLRNVNVAIFCEDYPSLFDRQIGKMRVEFPEWLGKLKEGTTRNFVLHERYGGGSIALRNLDDPSKYYSAEFAAIAVDELTRNPLSIFNDLRFRLRWPGIERPKFAAGTNPGGIGHDWVKAYWVTKKFPPEMLDISDQFVLVRAKAADNPYLSESYSKSLNTLPPDMAALVARGEWNIYKGQYFPQFDPELGGSHVIEGESFKPKPWWTKWISGDWGFEHPACFHWHCRDERGTVYTYKELWDRRVNESEWGKRISLANGGDKQQAFFFSWDAFGRKHESNRYSIADILGKSLASGIPKPTPADASPGERVVGWRLVSQLLDSNQWYITDNCRKLIECLPNLIRDEDNIEDVLKVDHDSVQLGDDPADSVRYGLKEMLAPRGVPKEVQREQMLAEIRAKALDNAYGPLMAPVLANVHNQQYMADLKWNNANKPKRMRFDRNPV